MSKDIRTQPIAESIEHLLNVISSSRFQRMEGLGNEVPFFIFDFNPSSLSGLDCISYDHTH